MMHSCCSSNQSVAGERLETNVGLLEWKSLPTLNLIHLLDLKDNLAPSFFFNLGSEASEADVFGNRGRLISLKVSGFLHGAFSQLE